MQQSKQTPQVQQTNVPGMYR